MKNKSGSETKSSANLNSLKSLENSIESSLISSLQNKGEIDLG